jgi:hypothetical protein
MIEAYLLLGWLPWVPPSWSWRGPSSQGHISLLLPGTRGLWGLYSVESGSGRLTYLAETKRGSRPSSVHSGHIMDRVLAAGEVKGSVFPSVPSGCIWSRPLEACSVVWACLEVGGGSFRAAAKSWAFNWSQASSQLSNTLNAIFTRSPSGVWGPSSACLGFFFDYQGMIGK